MLRLTAILILLSVAASAQAEKEGELSPRQRNMAAVESAYRENLEKYRDNKDMLVLPGLVANRGDKTVRIKAEATALQPSAPVEFLLIGLNSAHEYEATAVSFAKPSDIHRALEFVGMKPGRAANPNRAQFWPKGERVFVTFEWQGNGDDSDEPEAGPTGEIRRIAAESLVVVREEGRTKPRARGGFVFTGSAWRPAPGKPGEKAYAADAAELGPCSVISCYNEPSTVLDVPDLAPQGEVYNCQFPNMKYRFEADQLIDVILQPEYKDGQQRVADVTLRVSADSSRTNDTAGTQNKLLFRLTGAGGEVLAENSPFAKVLSAFEKLISDGKDPFVTVDFEPGLTIGEIGRFCPLLRAIDRSDSIRVDGPPPGRLFYKAFIPDESMRDRANRIVQPWELRIVETNGTVSGRMTLIDDFKDETGDGWTTRTNEFAASSEEQVRQALSTTNRYGLPAGIPVVFVFADKSLTYGKLTSLTAGIGETHPTVFVYPDQ